MSTGLRFTLEVDGLPPDAFAVVSFHLNQSLSSLFSLDLSLVSQQFLSLEFAQVLDKMAYLTIWQGDEVQRRVKGVVTWFELGENDKNQMLYSMKVHPPLWRAGLRQNFRIFQNEDIKSILGTMLQENGGTEWSPLFSEPHPSREFCVQYGETDYDFLCRMAAEEGIFFYEEHAYKSTDQSLVLCDTVRHLPESFEIPWNPNTRTEVSTLCISQFRYSAQIRPSSVVTKDYTFKRPGWAGRFEQEGQHQDYITPDPIGLRGGWNMYQYPLNPIQVIDPMGLDAIENMTSGGLIYAVSGVPGLIAANSITNSAYQFGYDMDAIVGGAHNGAADAMRHCYLMCRMTKTFGSTIADVIGKNHEAAGDRQGQPAKERIMDLKNNTVGIACGDFSAKCSDACIEKYNTGQLFGLDGIKADNPIKAKQGSSDASNY